MTLDDARNRAAIRAAELGHAMFWWRSHASWYGNCLDCGREAYIARQGVAGSALRTPCTGFRVPAEAW